MRRVWMLKAIAALLIQCLSFAWSQAPTTTTKTPTSTITTVASSTTTMASTTTLIQTIVGTLNTSTTMATNASANNTTMPGETKGEGTLIQTIVGTLTLLGGTQIQPIILIINGFIAAKVGMAWSAMLEDVNPQTVIDLFLAVVAGFSIGTVGVQNIQFQSILQGGVLFSSAFQVTIKDHLMALIDDNVDGQVRQWLVLGADAIFLFIGSAVAAAFKALANVFNSAYLSATMAVKGWIGIIEDASDEKVPGWLEFVATLVVMLIGLWWHSLMLSQQKVSSWAMTQGGKSHVLVRGTSFLERLKALANTCIVPVSLLNKFVQAISIGFGESCNLKGEPRTRNQIMIATFEKLGLPPPHFVLAKLGVKLTSKKLVGVAFKREGKSPRETKQTIELTGLVCEALDVRTMRAILFELRDGSGDFTKILDRLVDDVAIAVARSKRGKLGHMTPDEIKATWTKAKVGIKEQIEEKTRRVAAKSVIKLVRAKNPIEKNYIFQLFNALDLEHMVLIMRLVKAGRFSFEDLQKMAKAKSEELAQQANHALENRSTMNEAAQRTTQTPTPLNTRFVQGSKAAILAAEKTAEGAQCFDAAAVTFPHSVPIDGVVLEALAEQDEDGVLNLATLLEQEPQQVTQNASPLESATERSGALLLGVGLEVLAEQGKDVGLNPAAILNQEAEQATRDHVGQLLTQKVRPLESVTGSSGALLGFGLEALSEQDKDGGLIPATILEQEAEQTTRENAGDPLTQMASQLVTSTEQTQEEGVECSKEPQNQAINLRHFSVDQAEKALTQTQTALNDDAVQTNEVLQKTHLVFQGIHFSDMEGVTIARAVEMDGVHGAQPSLCGVEVDIGKIMLEKSYGQAPAQLADALLDIINFKEGVQRIPVLGPLINGVEASVRKTLTRVLAPIPYMGPSLIRMTDIVAQQVKRLVVQQSIAALVKKYQIPLKLVADVVRAFAEKDEYLDDMLEQIINPTALMSIMEDATGIAAPPKRDKITKSGSPKERAPEPTGIPALVMDQINKYGPTACRDKLMQCLTSFFGLDLDLAREFVDALAPLDLLGLGQAILSSGFNFERCTELMKNNVKCFDFSIPLKELEDGIQEDAISFSFSSGDKPPSISTISEDWIGQVKDVTRERPEPRKGDRLVSIGGGIFREYDKDNLEAALQEAVAKVKMAGDADAVSFTFERGLDIDVAEEFRRALPSILRKLLGVPFKQGGAFARNLSMAQMQQVVMILLMGGVKKLDDLAIDLQVEVNFEQALKQHLPLTLKRRFGFSLEGAKKFCQALDPATGFGINSFMVRFKQMLGFGDLEVMFAVLVSNDVYMLDQLHAKRYNPRRELNRLLNYDPRGTKKQISLVFTEKGTYELWQNDSRLGRISADTVHIILEIWRGNQSTHASENFGPIGDISPWSSEDVAAALQSELAISYRAGKKNVFFKWPEYVIEKAGLNDADAEVASKLFLLALVEAREDVWSKYHEKILIEACHCLGPGPHGETEGQQSAVIGQETSTHKSFGKIEGNSHKSIVADLQTWFKHLLAALPQPGPRRTKPLLQIEMAIKARDTFRLTKMASKFGISTPCPMDGLKDQLQKDLASLPIDITQCPNELAAFVAAQRNPLTAQIKGKIASEFQTPSAFASALNNDIAQSTLDDLQDKSDIEACSRPVPQLSNEGKHEMMMPVLPAKQTGISTPRIMCSAPRQGFIVGGQSASAQAPLKMKDLFVLSQKGDFGLLSKFSSTRCPGGAKEVATAMRQECIKILRSNYGMRDFAARKLVGCFHASVHFTVSATALKDDKPSVNDPMPANAEDRDGSSLAKNKRVSIIQEEEIDGEKYGLMARPCIGWCPMKELQLLPEAGQEEQEERAMKNVARLLRTLKEYDIERLQDIVDEHSLDHDFVGLAITHIVHMVQKIANGAYTHKSVESAARRASRRCIGVLKQCLVALLEFDLEFVIEAIELPPPPPPKPKSRPQPKPQAKPQPKPRPKDESSAIRKLQVQVEELTQRVVTKDTELGSKDQLLAEKINENEDLRKNVKTLKGRTHALAEKIRQLTRHNPGSAPPPPPPSPPPLPAPPPPPPPPPSVPPARKEEEEAARKLQSEQLGWLAG